MFRSQKIVKISQRHLVSRKMCTDAIKEEIRTANMKGNGVWEITHTKDKGWGIYAISKIPKFTKIFRARALSKGSERHSHSVQVGWNEHVFMDLPARFINHSCSANVGVKDNDIGAYDFFALKDVPQGCELTWDYGAAEFDSISIEQCLCGSASCRDTNIGFKSAHKEVRDQYGSHYAKYLHDWSL